jgi:hypothetical protein
MKAITVHIKESFENELEFIVYALSHPSLTLTRIRMEFAECVYQKFSDQINDLLAIHPQVNLICDDPYVATVFAAHWETKNIKPQRMKFKAEIII